MFRNNEVIKKRGAHRKIFLTKVFGENFDEN